MSSSLDINLVFFALFWFIGQLAKADEICYVGGFAYTYCDEGYHCCENDTKCCSNALSTGAIIGIVFACVAAVAGCVICVMCLVKKKNRHGHIIGPRGAQSVTVATINTQYPGSAYDHQHIHPYGHPPGQIYGQPIGFNPQYGMGSSQPYPPVGAPSVGAALNPAYPPPPKYM